MKKRALAILLTIVMVLCLLPVTVLAVEGDISVGGVLIEHTATTITYLKSNGAGGLMSNDATANDYCVSYDPASHILTLKNADFTTPKVGVYAYGIFVDTQDITLNLEGENTIRASTESDIKYGHGICISDYKKLTITGQGNLTVTGSNSSVFTSGIIAGTIEMNATGSVTVTGGTSDANDSHGIYATKNILITNGTIISKGGNAKKYSEGICALGNIEISGRANVQGFGGDSDTYDSEGIYAEGDITVSDSAVVNGTGGKAFYGSYGIICNGKYDNNDNLISGGNIMVSDTATVSGTGDTARGSAASEIFSDGIVANESLIISGGTVTGTGGNISDGTSEGIYAYRNITISGGKITGSGGMVTGNAVSLGIVCENGVGSITGGTVIAKGGSAALSGQNQPNFGTETWYKWRFSDTGAYTKSSTQSCALSTTVPFETYLEISPDNTGEMIWTLLDTKNNYNDTYATIHIDISEGNEYPFNYESDANGKAFIDGLNIQADYNGTLFFKVTNQSFEQTNSENEAVFKIVGYGTEKRFNILCVANHTEITSQTINNFSVNTTMSSSSKDIKKVEYSGDAIVVGDPDDIENANIETGTVTVSYDQINNYDRTITKVDLKYGATQTDYSISVLPCANGSAATDKSAAKQGEIVTIIPTPASGYKLKSIAVLDGLGQDLTQEIGLVITNNAFSMPDMNVQIKTVFEKINADGFTNELAASSGNINGSILFSTPVPDDCVLDIRTAPVPENLKQDGVLSLLLDITIMRNNSPYPIQDNQMTIKIILPNEMFNRDSYYVSYLNNDGVLFEKQEATVDGNVLTFTTNHLSGYLVEASDNALSHTHSYANSWSKDATSHWHECSCGDKSDTAVHSFGEWTQIKAATATENGSMERTCSVCGYKETAVIPATGNIDRPATESPQTGDNSNMILWIALLFVSGGVLGTLVVTSKSRRKHNQN